jgi:hypothetical protein
LVATVVAVLGGLAVYLQVSKRTTSTHTWEIFGALGVALVLAILALAVQIMRERPRLVVGQPSVEPVAITTLVVDERSRGANLAPVAGPPAALLIAYLQVWNEPKQGSRTAEMVSLRLRFMRGENVVREFPARWSPTLQPAGHESTQNPHEEDLAADGARHKFDVAAILPGERQCYAVNDRSRFLGWKAYPLGTGPVTVEVIAKGSNARTTSRWVLTHDGKTLCLVSKGTDG